jgi:hypothetical protein
MEILRSAFLIFNGRAASSLASLAPRVGLFAVRFAHTCAAASRRLGTHGRTIGAPVRRYYPSRFAASPRLKQHISILGNVLFFCVYYRLNDCIKSLYFSRRVVFFKYFL